MLIDLPWAFAKSKQRNGEFITFYNFNQLMNILRWEQDGNQLTTHVSDHRLGWFFNIFARPAVGRFLPIGQVPNGWAEDQVEMHRQRFGLFEPYCQCRWVQKGCGFKS